jgi:hypothetical protein
MRFGREVLEVWADNIAAISSGLAPGHAICVLLGLLSLLI